MGGLDEVGELKKYRDMDVQIRGIVQPMHGRAGMVLSHARQFYGGPPKFKPNPLLARGFSAEQEPASGQRPQPALAGRTPRVHEHEGPGDAAGQVAEPQRLHRLARLRHLRLVEGGAKRAPYQRIAQAITSETSVAPRPMLKVEWSLMAPMICGEKVSPKK